MSGNIETDIINKFNELTQKIKNSSADPNVVVPDDIKLKFYCYYKQSIIVLYQIIFEGVLLN